MITVHNVQISKSEFSELKRKASLAAINAAGWNLSEHLVEQTLIWLLSKYTLTYKENAK